MNKAQKERVGAQKSKIENQKLKNNCAHSFTGDTAEAKTLISLFFKIENKETRKHLMRVIERLAS